MLKKENWNRVTTTYMRPAAAAMTIITAMIMSMTMGTDTTTGTTMRRYTTQAGNLTAYPPE